MIIDAIRSNTCSGSHCRSSSSLVRSLVNESFSGAICVRDENLATYYNRNTDKLILTHISNNVWNTFSGIQTSPILSWLALSSSWWALFSWWTLFFSTSNISVVTTDKDFLSSLTANSLFSQPWLLTVTVVTLGGNFFTRTRHSFICGTSGSTITSVHNAEMGMTTMGTVLFAFVTCFFSFMCLLKPERLL